MHMSDQTMDIAQARKLNHVEFVHRPGERDLVTAFFKLLGIDVVDAMEGRYLVCPVDPGTFDVRKNENYFAGTQVRPEQWAFDQALIETLQDGPLAASFAEYQGMLDRKPQDGMHCGMHFSSVEEWESAIARIGAIEEHAPELAGRVRLCGVFRPDEPGSVAAIHQAFVWTDVIASGSLAFGQRIELSAIAPDAEIDF
jgi:hypothetical protein